MLSVPNSAQRTSVAEKIFLSWKIFAFCTSSGSGDERFNSSELVSINLSHFYITVVGSAILTKISLLRQILIFMGGFFDAFALQASLTSLTCPGTLALLDHHFLDHSYVSPEHTLTHMDLVLYKALGEANEKEAGLVGLQRWKRQISSRLDGGGGGLQGLKGDQVTLEHVMETINKDKPNKMKLNKTCESVSFYLVWIFAQTRSMMASSFSEVLNHDIEFFSKKSCQNLVSTQAPFILNNRNLL